MRQDAILMGFFLNVQVLFCSLPHERVIQAVRECVEDIAPVLRDIFLAQSVRTIDEAIHDLGVGKILLYVDDYLVVLNKACLGGEGD